MLSVRIRSLASSRARQEMKFSLHYSGGSRGGARPPPPLFLDRNEARRAEKGFFWRPHPPPPLI